MRRVSAAKIIKQMEDEINRAGNSTRFGSPVQYAAGLLSWVHPYLLRPVRRRLTSAAPPGGFVRQ